MLAGVSVTLQEAIREIPAACYERPTWKGVAYLLRGLLLYAGVVAGLVAFDHPLLLLPLWGLSGLTIASLFILGHDAAHGSLFRSKRLNYLVGQLSMLPSQHVFAAWVFGHNRVHHAHTTRELMDYVWHPLTPSEYAALSRAGRIAHRVKWSVVGAAFYYMHDIWWRRMMRFDAPEKIRAEVRRDRRFVVGYAAAASLAALALGAVFYGSALGAAWMFVKVLAVPFLAWNYVVGWAVYVHHVSPEIPWRTRRGWDRTQAQLEGTTILHVPRWMNFFLHNIMIHVPHHVDMRIPFYGLPRAARALRARWGDRIPEHRYRVADYLRATRLCKLFDFDAGTWCSHRGTPVTAHRPGPMPAAP